MTLIMKNMFLKDISSLVTWQLGLVEREINEILRGIAAQQKVKPSSNARRLAGQVPRDEEGSEGDTTAVPAGQVAQRPISEEDVCPICQEELLAKHMPVTYCKYEHIKTLLL